MLEPVDLSLEEMGDLADVIPGPEPVMHKIRLHEPYIPVCEPTLGGRELEYLSQCLQTNWISSAGKYIQDFQTLFAEKCGVRYGVACSNGTVALHLVLASLGLGPDDEVIIPAFTMIATANAVTYCGAKPVLVDSERETWNLDLSQVKAKISSKTKAIIPVHTYGHPVDMDSLDEIAQRHGVIVIEDAAEAHGAKYKGRVVGSLGTAACFSFYANKIITTGEGGMVTTDNEALAQLISSLRDHAFSKERHFWHRYVGFNYRMSNLQAAVGLAQTERLDDYVGQRRMNAAHYTRLLSEVPGVKLPPEAEWAENVFWMYGTLVDENEFGLTRDQLRQCLAERGIETRTFFIPIHCQPIYWKAFQGERFPVAEDLCRRGFYLPSSSSLTPNEIQYIARAIEDIQETKSRDH